MSAIAIEIQKAKNGYIVRAAKVGLLFKGLESPECMTVQESFKEMLEMTLTEIKHHALEMKWVEEGEVE